MKWYYESNGQPKGPILETELRRLRDEGKIAVDSLVWSDGMADWAPLNTLKSLSALPAIHTKSTTQLPVLADTPTKEHVWDISEKAQEFDQVEPPQRLAHDTSPQASEEFAESSPVESATPLEAPPEDASPEWERFTPSDAPTALLLSLKEILFEPQTTFRNLAHNGGWGLPLGFLILTELIGNCLVLLSVRQVPANASPLVTALRAMLKMEAGGSAVLYSIVSSTLLLPIVMVFKALVLHFSMRFLARSPFAFPTTFRCLCYAQGAASVLWGVPLAAVSLTNALGDPMAAVPALFVSVTAVSFWSLYVNVRALASAHEASFVRTAFSVLAPPILAAFLFALLVGGILTGGK